MFIWLFLIVAVVFFVLHFIADYNCWLGGDGGYCAWGIISSIIFGILLIAVLITNHRPEVSLQQKKEYYNSLNYKIESGLYKDQFDILDKDIVGEIVSWNQDVIYGKAMQYDFWFGNFTPDIYNDLQTIDYNIVK